jgi:hypothetical protein
MNGGSISQKGVIVQFSARFRKSQPRKKPCYLFIYLDNLHSCQSLQIGKSNKNVSRLSTLHPTHPLVDNSKHFNCNPSFVSLCGFYRTKSLPRNINEGAPSGQHLVSPSTHITIGEFHDGMSSLKSSMVKEMEIILLKLLAFYIISYRFS